MATDNLLTKKSVLGLAERVVMCAPPEIIDLRDIAWGGSCSLKKCIQTGNISQNSHSDIISLANKMPVWGTNICLFKDMNSNSNIYALIVKTSNLSFNGMGITNDGRVVYIIMKEPKLLASTINELNIDISIFGEAIE